MPYSPVSKGGPSTSSHTVVTSAVGAGEAEKGLWGPGGQGLGIGLGRGWGLDGQGKGWKQPKVLCQGP